MAAGGFGWTLQDDLVFFILTDWGRSFVDRQELWAYFVFLIGRQGCSSGASIRACKNGVALDFLALDELSVFELTLFPCDDVTDISETLGADTEALSKLGLGWVVGQEDERFQSSDRVQLLVNAPEDIVEQGAQVRGNARGGSRARRGLLSRGLGCVRAATALGWALGEWFGADGAASSVYRGRSC
jgi:hypothetical protein